MTKWKLAPVEPVLVVETEPGYWTRGHYCEGTKSYIDPTRVWRLPAGTKLYTAPPPPPPRLSDERILEVYAEVSGRPVTMGKNRIIDFARAIEREIFGE